jgi:hypothetical protein
VINAVLPAVSKTTGSLLASSNAVQERIATVWVKNVGAAKIAPLDRIDVFFGPTGAFSRVPYGDDSSCVAPCWYGTLETGTDWSPAGTLRINVKTASNLASGTTYYMKVVTPNGTLDSKYLTV